MHKRQSRSAIDNMGYSQMVRNFLSTFKVQRCELTHPHYYDYCEYYHSQSDRRRSPYSGHYLAYYAVSTICNCYDQACKLCHSNYEYYYHPFTYKTLECQNKCSYGLLCWAVHQNEQSYLQKHQFFRFDLQTFKTTECKITHLNSGEYASCRFYHGEADRRRDLNQVGYCHLQCGDRHSCKNKSLCQFAHNKIQQLYHPQRYKSKFCSKILKNQACEYLEFCSFAHADSEITIELLHKIPNKDSKFYYYKFKTVWCPFIENHQRSNCDYAHNFNDYRRDPLRFKYELGDCPYWSKSKNLQSLENSGCEKRMDCNKCHGWYECKYHPDNLLKGQSESEEEKEVRTQLAKNNQAFRRDDGLGTGAPFYKIQQKKETKWTPKKQEERKLSSSEQIENSSQKSEKSIQSAEGHQELCKEEDKKIEESIKQQQEKQNENQETTFGKLINSKINRLRRSSSRKKGITKRRPFWQFYHDNDGQPWHQNYDISQSWPADLFQKRSEIQSEWKWKKGGSFTSSFKKLISSHGVEQKLKKLQVRQIYLLELQQNDLNNEYFKDWTSNQKQSLMNAISKYRQQNKNLRYSKSFINAFMKNGSNMILEKFYQRKVTQNNVLALSYNSIKKLKFLESIEKQKLPIIIENYVDERDFKQLNEMIKTNMHPTP